MFDSFPQQWLLLLLLLVLMMRHDVPSPCVHPWLSWNQHTGSTIVSVDAFTPTITTTTTSSRKAFFLTIATTQTARYNVAMLHVVPIEMPMIELVGAQYFDVTSRTSSVFDYTTIFPTQIVTTILRSIVSAVMSYLTCVGIYDRPRGRMMVLSLQQEPPQPLPTQNGHLNDTATTTTTSTTSDAALQIRPSSVPNAGWGVFCHVPLLPRGTVLGTYPGVVLPLQQNLQKLQQYPHCETYIWRFSDSRYIIDPTNRVGQLEMVCYGGNPDMLGSIWLHQTVLSNNRIWNWIVPQFRRHSDHDNHGSSSLYTLPTTLLCRINEPPKGNRLLDVNVITVEDLDQRTITFVTERDVYENEELFIDYGLCYDRSRYCR
jgi:hypothetical protein